VALSTKDTLFTEAEALKSAYESVKAALSKSEERVALFEQENEYLRELLVKFKKMNFGPRSEGWETKEQGKLVFNEAEVEAAKACEDEPAANDEVEVKAHKKKRGHRRPLPKDLPREVVVIELAPEARFDDLGNPLVVVGKEISEKLSYEPAKILVTEYHRLRYGIGAGEPVKTAPAVPSIIPKGIATASLLAAIVTAKYADGLPLYRQEEMFLRQDVELSRTSMARWIVQAAEAIRPIFNILQDRLLESLYLACDETHVQVLKEEGRRAQSKSWMWVRTNPGAKEKIILFDYDPSRSGEVAKRLFEGYAGTLQCDGYGAYNAVEKNPGLIRIGCNMHGRRGFKEASEGSAKSKPLAEIALKFYKALYAIEEEAREKALTAEKRYLLRLAKAKPIWDEFYAWAQAANEKVLKKSSIGAGLHYFLGEYDYLIGYLKDGSLEIDNGHVERMIRKFAIGRNNWLFSDTPQGAEASAHFYSLVVTAKVNGVNPFEALKQAFTEIPLCSALADFERLANLFTNTKI